MAFQDQHHAVALLDPERLEVVGALVGAALQILEGDPALDLLAVDVEHRQFVGRLFRDRVDDIESEVETLGILEGDLGRGAVLVLLDVDELLVDHAALVALGFGAGRLGLCRRMGEFGDRFARRVEDDRVEGAVAPADGDHTVRRRTVVVDAVAGVQDLAVRADLHEQLPLDHEVTFLPRVGGQFDGLALRLFGIGADHEQGFGDPVAEGVRHIEVGHPVRVGDLLSLAGSGDGAGFQGRAVPLDDVGDVDRERTGAAVEEREVQVAVARLARDILLGRNAGQFRHLLGRKVLDLTERTDTPRHFPDPGIEIGRLIFHSGFLLGGRIRKKRTRPKVVL